MDYYDYDIDDLFNDSDDHRSDTSILHSAGFTCSSCGHNGVRHLTNECPNLIPTKPLKLEEMASISVAIGLWNHVTRSSSKLRTDWKFVCDLRDRVSKGTDKLPLPESFRQDIDHYVKELVEHVSVWSYYHCRKLFGREDWYGEDSAYLYRFVDRIVWHPNGAVNYYKTALNLLKSDRLSDLEKYRLACTYCLKEEIVKRWPRLLENGESVKAMFPNRYSDALFCYWNCYCAGKLRRVPAPEDQSIDEFMFLEKSVNNWPAIEYFFDRVPIERQVACVLRFIESKRHKYQELIFLKLNESQRIQVYAKKPVLIIQNYLKNQARIDARASEVKAISTWYEVRDLITGPQYVGLMNRLVRDCPPVSADFLMEIWNSSYDELKLPLLDHDRFDFIGYVIRWALGELEHNEPFFYRKHVRYDCDFFFAVLEEGAKRGFTVLAEWPRFNVRQRFFYRVCAEMTAKAELDLLTRTINLCVPSARDRAEVRQELKETRRSKTESYCVNVGCRTLISKYEFSKLVQFMNFFYRNDDRESRRNVRDMLLKYLINVDSYCLNFYLDGKVSELNEKLAPLISAYPEIVLTYKKELLFSKRGRKACYSHFDSTTNILTEIISDGLADEDDVIKFGKKLIFSDEGVRILHKLLRDKNFPHDVVKRNIDLLLKSNSHKKKLKQELLDSLSSRERRTDPLAKKKYYQFLTSFFGF